jgi:hypothetical protein
MEINGLVGATAWRAWILIYRDGPHTAAELKTKLNRSAELVNLSLGWLAREDRVEIVRTRKGIRVKLREDWMSPSRRARPASAAISAERRASSSVQ